MTCDLCSVPADFHELWQQYILLVKRINSLTESVKRPFFGNQNDNCCCKFLFPNTINLLMTLNALVLPGIFGGLQGGLQGHCHVF